MVGGRAKTSGQGRGSSLPHDRAVGHFHRRARYLSHGLTIIEAFFHSDVLTPPDHFVGFGNFTQLFSNAQVRTSIENTGWYALFGVVFTVAIGTGIGLLLQRPFRGRGIILAIVILPWALPGVVEGVIWSWIYNPTVGVLNSVLKSRAPHRPISAVYRDPPDRDDPSDLARPGLADHTLGRTNRARRAPGHPGRTVRGCKR